MKTKIDEYLESTDFIGMDNVLSLQRSIDGAVAAKFGITSLGPIGFIVGLSAGYLFFAITGTHRDGRKEIRRFGGAGEELERKRLFNFAGSC